MSECRSVPWANTAHYPSVSPAIFWGHLNPMLLLFKGSHTVLVLAAGILTFTQPLERYHWLRLRLTASAKLPLGLWSLGAGADGPVLLAERGLGVSATQPCLGLPFKPGLRRTWLSTLSLMHLSTASSYWMSDFEFLIVLFISNKWLAPFFF